MDKKHNQILLTTEDGRTVSIVQGGGTMGRSGQTCEIWVAGEEQPVGYLTVEELSKYLVEKVK